MDFVLVIILYLAAVAVGLAIFYFIIKAAVRNGIAEARQHQLVVEKRTAERAAQAAEVAKSLPPSGEIW